MEGWSESVLSSSSKQYFSPSLFLNCVISSVMRPGRPTFFRGWKVPGTASADGNHRARFSPKPPHCRQPVREQQAVLLLPLHQVLNLRRSENQGTVARLWGEQRLCWMFPEKEPTWVLWSWKLIYDIVLTAQCPVFITADSQPIKLYGEHSDNVKCSDYFLQWLYFIYKMKENYEKCLLPFPTAQVFK